MKSAVRILIAEDKPPAITGFFYSQGYARENQQPDATILRLRAWGRHEAWGMHIDVDLKKHGNELNQLSVSRATKLGTLRIGRVFLSDASNTIAPHNLKTATYPTGEIISGPFFAWGAQWEKAFGKLAVAADYANGKGAQYDEVLSSKEPVATVSAKYTFRKGAYVAAGSRYGHVSRRSLVDAGYTLGAFRANSFVYYTDEPTAKDRRVTGQTIVEWQANSWFAPHVALDLPKKGNEIYVAGIGIGNVKHLYSAIDAEFAGGRPNLAVRVQAQFNF